MAENVLTSPHLGGVRLAAYMASKGHKAEYFDINLHTLIAKGSSCKDKLKEKDWNIIGFKLRTGSFDNEKSIDNWSRN